MKNTFKLLFAVLFFSSCGGTDSIADSQVNDTTSFAVDTIVPLVEKLPTVDLNSLLEKFITTTTLPFKGDSAYVGDLTGVVSEALNGDEVSFLSQHMLKTDFYYATDYVIDDFLFIDSLKSIDKYDGYVDTLDLSETQESDAYVLDKIILNDSTTILLWCISYSTYEACPYGHGAYVYASILQVDKIISAAQLGEDSGGADAPYWGSTLTTFNLTKTGAKITKINSNGGDEDEEGNEIIDSTTEKFELLLVNNVWVVKE